MFQKQFVVIYGPTGVGKTEFADELACKVHGEIINADVGQFYMPLSIGTAKPLWKKSSIVHHLFDILDEPCDFTVTQYRQRVALLFEEIWQRGNLPIVVGGSGFYIASLFFPPQQPSSTKSLSYFENQETKYLWSLVKEIDPERAHNIHQHDRYRIIRALQIWQATGVKPSEYVPAYDPLAPFLLLCLNRDRDELYTRINKRVNAMMKEGWIDEVKKLQGTAWATFLMDKKIIGYHDILTYLSGPKNVKTYQELIENIAQKTRNYAKRQMTFWRMLVKKLEPHLHENSSSLEQINLTIINSQVYIKQMLEKNNFFHIKKK